MTTTPPDSRPFQNFRGADLIEKYIEIRDNKEALDAAHKERVAVLKKQMAVLEAEFNARMNAEGTEQIKSQVATVYYTSSDRAKCTDWDAFLAYAESTGQVDLTQRRLSTTKVLAHIEAQGGEVPPGIQLEAYREVRVRKS